MNSRLTFTIKENGKEKEYFVIKIFSYNKRDYIIFSEEDSKEVFGARYEIINDEVKLYDIETEDEYNYIDNILSNMGEK